jgi:hypothetical protein
MAGVQVDRHHRLAADLLELDRRLREGLPGGVQIPAVLARVVGDVVAHRAGASLGGDLVASVGKAHLADPVSAAVGVGQMHQRFGEPDLQGLRRGVPADRLVPQPLAHLAIRGQKPAGRLPPPAPTLLVQPGRLEVVPGSGQPAAATAHRYSALRQPGFHHPQTDLQDLETALFLPPLSPCRVPPRAALTTADRDGQPLAELPNPGSQTALLGQQVPLRQPPGVLAGPGDRPRPP